MKSIVVEGKFDYLVLETLFPQMSRRRVVLRVAYGFSNVFAVSKTLVDYGHEVLAVLDTDTNVSGNDNRVIMNRIQSKGYVGRKINIVWMDSCIEDVLRRAIPKMSRSINANNICLKPKRRAVPVYKTSGGITNSREIVLKQTINRNRDAIMALTEFMQIKKFIEGK